MSDHLFRDIEASLLKFCKDLIAEKGWTTFKPFNFDRHATVNELPNFDLLGISELSIVNSDRTYEIMVAFIICTKNDDTDLANVTKVCDTVFGRLIPGYKGVSIVDFTTGAIQGNLAVESPVTVPPVAFTKGRPLRSVFVTFGSSLLVPP